VSYQSQWQLAADVGFVGRSRACIVQQSELYGLPSSNAQVRALAGSLLVDDNPQEWITFLNVMAAGPGLADKVDQGDGTIDSTLIDDEEILSSVQNEFPGVAALFYDAAGEPLG
jgi:hypothetical protein